MLATDTETMKELRVQQKKEVCKNVCHEIEALDDGVILLRNTFTYQQVL